MIAEIKKIAAVLKQPLFIPDYQRPYRWHENNVRQLLEDIFESWKAEKTAYRVGSVILCRDNENKFAIVDGQQRITTIVLILSALKSGAIEELSQKLTYNHYDSHNNISKNNKFIESWKNEKLKDDPNGFYEYITNSCEFVEIVVENLSDAFQMFDSQNGRGKELEPYNLLKAYHIRAMDSETQETKIECDKRWENATIYKYNNGKDTFDILAQLFSEQIYRTRVWSRKDIANEFSKKEITEFKGVAIDTIKYPFQNKLLLQIIADIKGTKSRFNCGDPINIKPCVQINQNIINGKLFFDYIETYSEIYKSIFIDSYTENVATPLCEFKKFFKEHCLSYTGAYRTGDGYLRELYKSLIFLVFDKYGEDGVNKFYETLYALVYRIRLEKKQVRYACVAKYPLHLFSAIERSKDYTDFRELEIQSKADIKYVKKNETFIEDFFRKFGVKLNEVTNGND